MACSENIDAILKRLIKLSDVIVRPASGHFHHFQIERRIVNTLSLGGDRQQFSRVCGHRKYNVGAGHKSVGSIVQIARTDARLVFDSSLDRKLS